MSASFGTAGVGRLRKSIAIYLEERTRNLSNGDQEVLSRLLESPEALNAIERLASQGKIKIEDILTICIKADQTRRNFPRLLAQLRGAIQKSTRARKALEELHANIDGQAEELVPFPEEISTLTIYEPPPASAEIQDAFILIMRQIDWGNAIAELAIAQIGATRKSRGKTSAQNAGIWLLAARILGETGKHHFSKVADLVAAIFKVEVTDDQLRHLLRVRNEIYAEAIGMQTHRYHANKVAEARRRRSRK